MSRDPDGVDGPAAAAGDDGAPAGDATGGPAPGTTPQPSNERGEGSVRVVGTAHVSEASVREVEETVAEARPDIVAVELDEGRYRQMRGETPDDLDPGDLLKGNTVFQFLAYWMLSYVQTRMGERFDIDPGAELLAAVDTAEELGISVALVDRDIQTTIQRFWARLSVVEKLRMVGALAFGITDPRVAGVTFGLVVGLLLGPAIGLFGGAVGITGAVLTRVGVGALAGALAGYLGYRAAAASLGGDADADAPGGVTTLGVGAVVAVAVAGAVVVTGVGVAPVAGLLSGTVLTAVGSLTLGLAAGLGVGAVAALAIGALGIAPAADEEFEEFDPDELTDADVVTAMMEEFRQFSPGGAEALIDERDAYIAHQLVGLRNEGYDVVAVVGAGHRAGIESYLEAPETLPPDGVARRRREVRRRPVGEARRLRHLGGVHRLLRPLGDGWRPQRTAAHAVRRVVPDQRRVRRRPREARGRAVALGRRRRRRRVDDLREPPCSRRGGSPATWSCVTSR